jgi:hypothetical protein
LIRAGGAVLAFDTNAVLGYKTEDNRKWAVFGRFLDLCDDMNQIGADARSPLNVEIVVPALVRMEGVRRLRVSLREREFDAESVKSGLRGRARVVAFDEDSAIDASGTLHQWFDTDEKWQQVKRERCLEARDLTATNSSKACGLATIDWAIAAESEAKGWILVTEDGGLEFRHVSRKLTKQAVRDIVDKLLVERGLLPSQRRQKNVANTSK